ncbi:hypothetical protein [Aquipuribacter hungaricus]|uniref:Uncharacterized protein n=1 Tax=Aquipuribacter hungaricus TaxID=545624 RepID=A0ABV7WDD5_9MICO
MLSETDLLADLVVTNGRVVDIVQDAYKARLLQPLLMLDLPCIEGTSLRDYCTILVQEANALDSLQHYLRPKLMAVTASGDPNEYNAQLALLSNEISDGVRLLQSELRKASRVNAVQASGGSLAVCTAALVALDVAALADAASVVGVGGGIWALVTAVQNRLEGRADVRERPHYLFWLLDKQARPA